jgi:sodium/proline symporter
MGALALGWIGIAIFGPEGLSDRETVMPAVLLEIFPPAIAAILITGAIAAMISTADSLLILSATELSENIIKPSFKGNKEKNDLMFSRVITALLAELALVTAYIVPSDLIFDLVGWVWAGVGANFSVVILLTLFWKRFHGRAALITIVTGVSFTIFWITSGMDEIITARIMTFIVALATAFLSTWMIPPAGKSIGREASGSS